jgi:hypothetical protein
MLHRDGETKMAVLNRLKAAANDFSTPRLLRDPAEVEIPQLRDDPRYAAAAELRSTFEQRMARLEREKMRMILARDLNGRTPDPKSTSDQALRARLAVLSAEPPIQPLAPTPTASTSPAIALAMEVLNGKPVAAAPDYAAQIQEIDRQIEALYRAICEQAAIVDDIADELTLEYALRLRPAWNQLQIEMYRAAQELARTTKRVQQFRNAITAAGIRSRSDILAMPNVRAPLILGDETHYDSEITGWRRILERLEIL